MSQLHPRWSKDNPADIASRSSTPQNLVTSSLWWEASMPQGTSIKLSCITSINTSRLARDPSHCCTCSANPTRELTVDLFLIHRLPRQSNCMNSSFLQELLHHKERKSSKRLSLSYQEIVKVYLLHQSQEFTFSDALELIRSGKSLPWNIR